MKFYDREKEIEALRAMREASFSDHSRLTVVTGRRRIGKTSLIVRDKGGEPFIYLFVGRKNEASLCAGFCKEIAAKLDIHVPNLTSFDDVFALLMQLGETRKFTVAIDEFQEFFNINPSIYSDIQNHWDQYRLRTHVNLIVSGSIYSLMTKIFQDNHEPLFGRADAIMKIAPFPTSVLKQILADYNPSYTNDDLLALFTITGGVPKYVELLVDNHALTVESMIHAVCNPISPFREEGKNLLIEEFGKNHATYFSILDAIASGRNTQATISDSFAEKNIGGQLKILEETYEVISKHRPIYSKPNSQTVRYYINDPFLQFWFRYFEGNRALIELGQNDALQRIIMADYTTYSGKVLESYFKQKLKESGKYIQIGSYWESKPGKEQYEIDIVAVASSTQATAIEVKRQRKEFKSGTFAEKVKHLHDKVMPKHQIEQICLTLEDI